MSQRAVEWPPFFFVGTKCAVCCAKQRGVSPAAHRRAAPGTAIGIRLRDAPIERYHGWDKSLLCVGRIAAPRPVDALHAIHYGRQPIPAEHVK